MKVCFRIWFYTSLTVWMWSGVALGTDVFILSSSDIIPYNTCIEGIKQSLGGYSHETITIDQDLGEARKTLQKVKKEQPRSVIAVGPQAAYVLSRDAGMLSRFFCMVLNPAKLLGPQGLYSGISLNISPAFQIEKINEAFPDRTRIGVFFNPASNQDFVEELNGHARRLGKQIVAFPVDAQGQIADVLRSKGSLIDLLLLVPDDNLKNTKLVEYIISETLRRKIPVIGYNSWFARNGALLSFIVDYRQVGIQAGESMRRLLQQNLPASIEIVPPGTIYISVNLKTAKKLGITIAPAIIGQAHEVVD